MGDVPDDSPSARLVPSGALPLPRVARNLRLAAVLRRRSVLLGVGMVVFFAVLAVAAPLLAPHHPAAMDATRRLEGPSLRYPLGTDNLGRDLLSRLLYGSRWSLSTVALATAMIMSIGIAVGAIAGFLGGLIDDLLMRIVDVLLAIPSLLLALAVAGTLGPGIGNVMAALVIVWWASYARVVRGLVLAVRERRFVEAAGALGAPRRHVLLRHVMPNVIPPVVVLATVEMGELILAIAGLNFLGLGVRPPTPEWGAMLNDGRPFLLTAPHLMIYPGLAISLLVIGFNLVGDGLRDLLDPKG